MSNVEIYQNARYTAEILETQILDRFAARGIFKQHCATFVGALPQETAALYSFNGER